MPDGKLFFAVNLLLILLNTTIAIADIGSLNSHHNVPHQLKMLNDSPLAKLKTDYSCHASAIKFIG